MQRAFTLLELLIVVGLLILLTASIFTYSHFQSGSDREILAQTAASLRLSWFQAQAGLDNQTHGLKLSTNSLVFFEGDSFNQRNQGLDQSQTYPDLIISWSLNGNGAGDEIVFAKNTGRPSRQGSINFAFTDGRSGQLLINELGLVEISNP